MTRTIVMTGGTGGLGTALAKRLVTQDVRLAVTYLLPNEATQFEETIELDDDRLMLKRVDAANASAVTDFMSEVADEWGGVHGLAALVGGWAGGRDIDETDDLRLERMLDLNLRSAFYTVRAAIPHLQKAEFGRIVLVGSRATIENPPWSGGIQHVESRRDGTGTLGCRRTRSDQRHGIGAGAICDRYAGNPRNTPLCRLCELADS